MHLSHRCISPRKAEKTGYCRLKCGGTRFFSPLCGDAAAGKERPCMHAAFAAALQLPPDHFLPSPSRIFLPASSSPRIGSLQQVKSPLQLHNSHSDQLTPSFKQDFPFCILISQGRVAPVRKNLAAAAQPRLRSTQSAPSPFPLPSRKAGEGTIAKKTAKACRFGGLLYPTSG